MIGLYTFIATWCCMLNVGGPPNIGTMLETNDTYGAWYHEISECTIRMFRGASSEFLICVGECSAC